jgi:hypothetical protein
MDRRPSDRLATWAPWAIPDGDPVSIAPMVQTRPAALPPTPIADPHLAGIFRTMRAVVGGNEAEVARRLGTDVSVIMDLEAGVIDFLPAWPETERLVQRYGAAAGVDVAAVLDAMARLIAAKESARRPPPPLLSMPSPEPSRPVAIVPVERPSPSPMPAQAPPPWHTASAALQPPPPPPPPALARATEEPLEPQRLPRPALGAVRTRSSPRTLLAAGGLGLAALAGLYLAITWAPRPLYASARMLPAPIDRPVRALADTIVWATAPMHDGLRSIDVSNPRLRKADRLDAQPPTAPRR